MSVPLDISTQSVVITWKIEGHLEVNFSIFV